MRRLDGKSFSEWRARLSAKVRTFLAGRDGGSSVVAGYALALAPLVLALLATWRLAGLSGWAAAALAVAGGLGLAIARRRQLAEHPGGSLRPERGGRLARAAEFKVWHRLLDAMPEAAVALDGDGRVLHHNAFVTELFPGVSLANPLSRSIRNPDLIAAIDQAIGSGGTVVVQLNERVPVERRISATVKSIGPQSERRPADPAILVTFRDLSEQDKLAQMREDFVANASHELRTPLAAVKGFVETLQGPARDDPAARDRFLGMMATQAERMNRLIDDLLSLSRVEMRAHLQPRGIVDLNEVAAYVSQSLEPVIAGADAKLRVAALDTPARIRGDRDQMVQVLINLVQNAIVYGGKGVEIDVRISRVASADRRIERLSMAVTDNGPGIAQQHLPRLTERFYRANVASSRSKGGTGLGLAIVKHIVARHRGELTIASEVGKGSTFAVTFDALQPRPD